MISMGVQGGRELRICGSKVNSKRKNPRASQALIP